MAGLHVFSHTSEEKNGVNCAICIHVNTNNLTLVIAHDLQDFEINNAEYLYPKDITKTYSFIISNEIASNQLFSRPPPISL
ncbi:hypothetical protein ACSTS3_12200 [Aquimarina muelleri]